jgi:hypothetical protein
MSELRDALDEAYVEEEGETSEQEDTGGQATEEPVPGTDEETGGAPETLGDVQAASEPEGGEQAAAEPEKEGVKPEPSGPAYKPPIDWGAGLREHWGKLDPSVQEKIAHREAQMAQAMQGTAQSRQTANDFQALSNQYGSVMAAEGAQNPMQAIQGLLQTTTELRMGTPAQKAQRMAQMITHFGVDIGMLDSAIVGDAPANQQAAHDQGMQQMIDQRMAPVNDMMHQLAQMQQQKHYGQQYAVQQEVETFRQGAEFLEDVRQDMGDLINIATGQNRDMPLQEAYDKACMMNPQIQKIMEDRQLIQGKQAMASKKNAGSSISGRGIGSQGAQPQDLHSQLNAVWDDLAG